MSSHMLDERYLIHGLDALSRAYKSDYFADGHRGAAIIAAYYFCREVPVEDGVAGIIRATLDEHWTHTGLCAPFPPERADPALITRILEAVERNVCGLRQAGHNVILPSLALRALQLLPEATTPSRVDGICRLVDAFKAIDDIHLDERDDIPDLGQGPATAEFVLSELPSTIAAFGGRGQGWSGHLLTYGRALIDMREMGYGALAHRAEHGFKRYIKRIRMGPQEIDRPRPEHPPTELRPHQRAYWQARRHAPVGIGHVFKYPYGFYGLMHIASDNALVEHCMRVADHIL